MTSATDRAGGAVGAGGMADRPVVAFGPAAEGGFIVLAVNHEATEAFGVTPEQAGRPLAGTALAPLAGPVLAVLSESLAGCRPAEGDIGAGWRLRVTPLRAGAGAPVQLIGRFEAAGAALQDLAGRTDFFQVVIDTVPVPIFIKDAAGRYIFCNAAFGTFQGRPAAEFIGRTVFEVAPPDLARVYHEADRALFAAGGQQVYEAAVRRPDGSQADVVFCKSVFAGPDGGAGGIIGAILDISARKAAERDLHAATQAADQANRMKSQFLVTMSHELRTPLNAILGFSEVIKDQLCGPVGNRAYADYAADIHTAGEHLLSLINDILDLSKIEAGRMELEVKELDLSDLLAGAIRLVVQRAQNQRISLRLDLADPVPQLVADERAVKQILFNLLGNAVKFTPAKGRVTLSASTPPGGGVLISVADNGGGIPADQIERIMRPFERLDNRYGCADGGTGLGMALVKALTELHGGSVSIESAAGAGTRVAIHLPAEPPAGRR